MLTHFTTLASSWRSKRCSAPDIIQLGGALINASVSDSRVTCSLSVQFIKLRGMQGRSSIFFHKRKRINFWCCLSGLKYGFTFLKKKSLNQICDLSLSYSFIILNNFLWSEILLNKKLLNIYFIIVGERDAWF